MKKVVSLAVAGATLAGAAFADVNFGVWGRTNWVVGNVENEKGTDDHVATFMTQSWTGYAPRIGLSVSGDAGNVGFAFDIHNNGDKEFKQGDNCYVWAKPIEQVELSLGKHDRSFLRGDACFGLWNTLRFGVTKGPKGESEGWTFMDTDKNGAIIKVDPIENLTLLASVGFPLTNDDGANSWNLGEEKSGVRVADALGTDSIYAVAYTLPEVATFKVGVNCGEKVNDDDYLQVINASVEVNAVENAYFAVGAFIPTVGVKDGGAPTIVNLYGNYKVNDQLKAHLKAGLELNTKDDSEGKVDDAMGFSVSAGADYDIGDGLSAYAHVEYANGVYMANTTKDAAENSKDCFDFGLGIFKALANGKIGVSFIGATNNYGFSKVYDNGFAWAVPVTLEYWF